MSALFPGMTSCRYICIELIVTIDCGLQLASLVRKKIRWYPRQCSNISVMYIHHGAAECRTEGAAACEAQRYVAGHLISKAACDKALFIISVIIYCYTI